MASFALIFVPPWIAFRRAGNWQRAQGWAIGLGVGGYVLAFWLALTFDQPFGPVLVAVLVLACVMFEPTPHPACADLARR